MIANSPRISRWPQMTPELGHGDRQDHDNKETQDQEEPIALRGSDWPSAEGSKSMKLSRS
jgi:hypothetical protein